MATAPAQAKPKTEEYKKPTETTSLLAADQSSKLTAGYNGVEKIEGAPVSLSPAEHIPENLDDASQQEAVSATVFDVPAPSHENSGGGLTYRLFTIVFGLAALASMLMIVAQLLVLDNLDGLFIELVLKIWMILFSIMLILSELQAKVFFDFMPSFDNWLYRGFLYCFIGVVGVEMSAAALAAKYPQNPSYTEFMTSLLLKVVSYYMFGIGVVYLIMGFFCLHRIFERARLQRFPDFDQSSV